MQPSQVKSHYWIARDIVTSDNRPQKRSVVSNADTGKKIILAKLCFDFKILLKNTPMTDVFV